MSAEKNPEIKRSVQDIERKQEISLNDIVFSRSNLIVNRENPKEKSIEPVIRITRGFDALYVSRIRDTNGVIEFLVGDEMISGVNMWWPTLSGCSIK